MITGKGVDAWWDSVWFDIVLDGLNIPWRTGYIDCEVMFRFHKWQDQVPLFQDNNLNHTPFMGSEASLIETSIAYIEQELSGHWEEPK